MPLLWFAFSIAMCFVVANVARGRGLNPWPYAIVAVIFWPLALILVYVVPADKAGVEHLLRTSGGMKKCPSCAEMIKAEAKVCRYCGHGRDGVGSSPSAQPLDPVAQMNADDLARFRGEKK